MSGTGTLIDLGTISPAETQTDTDVPRRLTVRRIQTASAVLAVAMALATGGSAPPAPPVLREIFAVAAGPDDDYLLTEDRLYVAKPAGRVPEVEVTAYDTDLAGARWAIRYHSTVERLSLTEAAGLLLVNEANRVVTVNDPARTMPRTTALDSRTGQRRWSVPYQLTVLPGESLALNVESVFPPGSWVDSAAPLPGVDQLFASSSGELYLAAPIGVMARVVDLASGSVVWASPLVADVRPVPASAGHAAALVVTTTDRSIEIVDLRTWAVRHRLAWADGDPEMVYPAGDLLLVLHAGRGMTAYSADLQEKRWIRPISMGSLHEDCLPVICEHGPDGYQVVRPATGVTAWGPSSVGLFPLRFGNRLMEIGEVYARRVVDPDSGQEIVDLSGWRPPTPLPATGPLSLTRDAAVPIGTWLGILGPASTAVHILGKVPYRATGCQAIVGRIACHTARDELRIWRYR